jgi:lipopolysaccharide biosynthesis glycosyltransferase
MGNFGKLCLLGRFFLQEFTSSDYILHIDSDVWMVKPWIGPLVEDISSEGQSDKLLWGGVDWGLMVGENIAIVSGWGIAPATYINAGFFLFRNNRQTRMLMNASVEFWIKHINIFCADQTVLNIVFNTSWKGILSERFSKWNHVVCKNVTINAHGSLPQIERRFRSELEEARAGSTKWH